MWGVWKQGPLGGPHQPDHSQLLTFNRHLAATHQVGFVPHQDDGDVLSLPCTAQLDAQLGGALKAAPVRDGVDDDVGVPHLQALVSEPAVTLSPHGVRHITTLQGLVAALTAPGEQQSTPTPMGPASLHILGSAHVALSVKW